MAKIYDFILQGDEATENGARAAVDGLDWTEVESAETDLPRHKNLVDIVAGVGIWYDFGADYYFFTDETGEN